MKLKTKQLEAIVRIVANMTFGFNGSDPNNPPQKGLRMATETLKESIEFFLKEEREEMGKFLLEKGHGGGNFRRLITMYLESNES